MFRYLLLLVALLPFATATYDKSNCAEFTVNFEDCEDCCEEVGNESERQTPYMVLEPAWKALPPFQERECICVPPPKMSDKELKSLDEAVERFNREQDAS
jgi:hypothetical protein